MLLLPLLAMCLTDRALPMAQLLASFPHGSGGAAAKRWLAAAARAACCLTLPVADPGSRACVR